MEMSRDMECVVNIMNDCEYFGSGHGAGVARQPMDRRAACSNMGRVKNFIFKCQKFFLMDINKINSINNLCLFSRTLSRFFSKFYDRGHCVLVRSAGICP